MAPAAQHNPAILSMAVLALLVQSALCLRLLTSQEAPPVVELLVLGDSLSDNGNRFAMTEGTYPDPKQGYFEGRFSNGPVWNEYLANTVGFELINRAIGGAEACNPTFVPTLIEQVDLLVGKVASKPNTIVSITIGGNDYLTPARFTNQPIPAPEKIVGCIVEALEKLLEQGFVNIMIWNLPTAGAGQSDAPAAQGLEGIVPVFIKHNQVLADALVHVQHKNPSAFLMVYDLWQSFEDLFAAGKAEFKDPFNPCLVFDANFTLLSTCSNPDDHIFWDEIHPTTRTHAILADKVNTMLYQQYWY